MIITGIILVATFMVLAIINIVVMFVRDGGDGGHMLFHALCAIGYITGFVLIAIGVVDKLGWA